MKLLPKQEPKPDQEPEPISEPKLEQVIESKPEQDLKSETKVSAKKNWRYLKFFCWCVVLATVIFFFFPSQSKSSVLIVIANIIYGHVRIHEGNLPNYYEDNLHSTWTFETPRHYNRSELFEWGESHRVVKEQSLWTEGENGLGFIPKNSSEKVVMDQLKNEFKYNIFASDRISVRRSLPDYRSDECRNLTYPEKLPKVSVIIKIHDEEWSMLLRTIWSVIDRSPLELLQEIILVDDASTSSVLKKQLEDYAKKLPVNITIIRLGKREGLVRARIIGALYATGSVLAFLAPHMECTEGWLEPMLARIASDRSVVVVPHIDTIEADDLSYKQDKMDMFGFNWNLLYYRLTVPKREMHRINYDKTAPIRTPTHIGTVFSVDRDFFFEIGAYDEEMHIYGSENAEMSFRVWMCGGSLEILPCSHVGQLNHVSTYSFDDNKSKLMAQYNGRLVEVWMDEFKEIVYGAAPESREILVGDLTKRKNLREQLKCKSFRWYLENIYPESSMQKEYIAMGEIKSVSAYKCLDIYPVQMNKEFVLYSCHGMGGYQFFGFAKTGQIAVSVQDACLGINDSRSVVLVQCSDSDRSQLWNYDEEKQWIVHRESNLCMKANENNEGVILASCNSTDIRFQWKIHSTIQK